MFILRLGPNVFCFWAFGHDILCLGPNGVATRLSPRPSVVAPLQQSLSALAWSVSPVFMLCLGPPFFLMGLRPWRSIASKPFGIRVSCSPHCHFVFGSPTCLFSGAGGPNMLCFCAWAFGRGCPSIAAKPFGTRVLGFPICWFCVWVPNMFVSFALLGLRPWMPLHCTEAFRRSRFLCSPHVVFRAWVPSVFLSFWVSLGFSHDFKHDGIRRRAHNGM